MAVKKIDLISMADFSNAFTYFAMEKPMVKQSFN